MKKRTKILIVLFVILLIIIGIIWFFLTKNERDVIFDVTGSNIVFIGDESEFKVTNNSETVFVNYKNGYLKSDKNNYEDVNPIIPFKAVSAGNEEVTFKVSDKEKKLNILVCNKIDTKNKIIAINAGDNRELKFNISNECLNAYNFSVDDTEIASYENGKIVAKKTGVTKLTIKRNNEEYIYTIKVVTNLEPIKFSESSTTINLGETKNLIITGVSDDLICTTSDIKIVTAISDKGFCIIKAIKEGEVQITAESNGLEAKSTVKVVIPPKIVTIKVATWNLARYSKPTITVKKQAEFFKTKSVDLAAFQNVKDKNGSMVDPLNTYKSVTGYNYIYYDLPAGNAIVSKYSMKSIETKPLVKCNEDRGLLKTIINVNGVDISIYDTHFSYQNECLKKQADSLVELIKGDHNPQILMGDFSTQTKTILTEALDSNYEIIAHDTIKNIYGDSIIIKSKNQNGNIKLKVVNTGTIKTAGIYTDHNMVIASIQVIN